MGKNLYELHLDELKGRPNTKKGEQRFQFSHHVIKMRPFISYDLFISKCCYLYGVCHQSPKRGRLKNLDPPLYVNGVLMINDKPNCETNTSTCHIMFSLIWI